MMHRYYYHSHWGGSTAWLYGSEADRKLAYGKDSLKFGELRLPKTPGAHPVS
jgi:hypothetical protein